MVSTTTAKATITMLVKVVAAISALRRDAPSELQTRVQRVGVQQLGGRGLGAFGDAVREDVLRLAGRPGGRGRRGGALQDLDDQLGDPVELGRAEPPGGER